MPVKQFSHNQWPVCPGISCRLRVSVTLLHLSRLFETLEWRVPFAEVTLSKQRLLLFLFLSISREKHLLFLMTVALCEISCSEVDLDIWGAGFTAGVEPYSVPGRPGSPWEGSESAGGSPSFGTVSLSQLSLNHYSPVLRTLVVFP